MIDEAISTSMLHLKVARVYDVAAGIRSLVLVHPQGEALPPFTPGSHVKVQTPAGLVRKYSLCNDPRDKSQYTIAVKRDAAGRGGSISMVDQVAAGDILPVSLPDNAFPMSPGAARYLFIAGGIGITPILSMIRSLDELSPPWKLYYFTQSPETTAFLDELTTPELRSRVHVHHDFGDPNKSFDLWPLLEKPSNTQIYCCGPRGLMDAVRDMSGHWSPANVHFESFVEGGVPLPDDTPFIVTLARSQLRLEVPVGKTMLSVMREAGVSVPSSCESGTCGSCRTTLLSGVADHRDMVLMPEEQDTQIMVCVSRACSGELVIDR
jgi:phthalate 4,5-dioxygenase reductase subunit